MLLEPGNWGSQKAFGLDGGRGHLLSLVHFAVGLSVPGEG